MVKLADYIKSILRILVAIRDVNQTLLMFQASFCFLLLLIYPSTVISCTDTLLKNVVSANTLHADFEISKEVAEKICCNSSKESHLDKLFSLAIGIFWMNLIYIKKKSSCSKRRISINRSYNTFLIIYILIGLAKFFVFPQLNSLLYGTSGVLSVVLQPIKLIKACFFVILGLPFSMFFRLPRDFEISVPKQTLDELVYAVNEHNSLTEIIIEESIAINCAKTCWKTFQWPTICWLILHFIACYLLLNDSDDTHDTITSQPNFEFKVLKYLPEGIIKDRDDAKITCKSITQESNNHLPVTHSEPKITPTKSNKTGKYICTRSADIVITSMSTDNSLLYTERENTNVPFSICTNGKPCENQPIVGFSDISNKENMNQFTMIKKPIKIPKIPKGGNVAGIQSILTEKIEKVSKLSQPAEEYKHDRKIAIKSVAVSQTQTDMKLSDRITQTNERKQSHEATQTDEEKCCILKHDKQCQIIHIKKANKFCQTVCGNRTDEGTQCVAIETTEKGCQHSSVMVINKCSDYLHVTGVDIESQCAAIKTCNRGKKCDEIAKSSLLTSDVILRNEIATQTLLDYAPTSDSLIDQIIPKVTSFTNIEKVDVKEKNGHTSRVIELHKEMMIDQGIQTLLDYSHISENKIDEIGPNKVTSSTNTVTLNVIDKSVQTSKYSDLYKRNLANREVQTFYDNSIISTNSIQDFIPCKEAAFFNTMKLDISNECTQTSSVDGNLCKTNLINQEVQCNWDGKFKQCQLLEKGGQNHTNDTNTNKYVYQSEYFNLENKSLFAAPLNSKCNCIKTFDKANKVSEICVVEKATQTISSDYFHDECRSLINGRSSLDIDRYILCSANEHDDRDGTCTSKVGRYISVGTMTTIPIYDKFTQTSEVNPTTTQLDYQRTYYIDFDMVKKLDLNDKYQKRSIIGKTKSNKSTQIDFLKVRETLNGLEGCSCQKENIGQTVHSLMTLPEQYQSIYEPIKFKAKKSSYGIWYVSLRGDIFLTICKEVLNCRKITDELDDIEKCVEDEMLRTMKIFLDNYKKLSTCFDDDENESEDESFINGFRL